MTEQTISFVVDEYEGPGAGVRSSRSAIEQLVGRQIPRIMDFQMESVVVGFQQRIQELNEVFARVDTSDGPFDIDSVSVNLVVTASGKVGILSAIEGSLSGQVGIVVNLKRRQGVQ
jgi:hypothetical protein